MPAKPLTPEQLQDASRLNALLKDWQARQRTAGKKASQDYVADQLGIGQSALSQYVNGKIPLNVEFAKKVSDFLGVDVEQFSRALIEELRALTDGIALRIDGQPASTHIDAKPDTFVIKQYDTGGSMGRGFLLRDQPGLIESWTVNREWATKNLPYYTNADNLGIVTGFGDSMQGMFNPGDPILVDRGITSCEVDGVYFFRVDDEGFIKRLQRIPGEGILVISENNKYRDWTIKPTMNFQVLAKVLTVWKSEQY